MANSRRSKRELARLPGESQAEAQARSIRDQGEAHESQILEKDIEERRPGYRAYIERTSGFFPLPPKGG